MRKIIAVINYWIVFGLQIINRVVCEENPCRLTVSNAFQDWLHKDGGLRFPEYRKDFSGSFLGKTIPAYGKSVKEENKMGGSCYFSESTRDVTCTGTLDFDYLKSLNSKHIRRLSVDSYNGHISKQKDPSSSFRHSVSLLRQTVTGEIIVRDLNVVLRTVLDLNSIDFNRWRVNGEVFSNKIVKIAWTLSGNINRIDASQFWLTGAISSNNFNPRWMVEMKMELVATIGKFQGNVSDFYDHTLLTGFDGFFNIQMSGGEKHFHGRGQARDIDIAVNFFARVKQDLNFEVTIPKKAFSGMTIQHLNFKDSDFFGDFDSNSLEGINGLETITFLKSNIELMSSYGNIFRVPSLKALYIEDSYTPRNTQNGLKCETENIELISFKGSGFLELSSYDFQWLSCSNITYINFHDANIELIDEDPIFLPIKNKLKYLDISYSTIRYESQMLQILKGLKITHLSLAGLQLKNVPTAALRQVKDTLEYLSMRLNQLQKIPDKNLLVQVLNFPKMPALTELDLQRCEINYIEKGAFDPLINLKKLDISQNNILNFNDGWANTVPQILYLNLSHNGKALRDLTFDKLQTNFILDLSKLIHLESLDLSNSKLTDLKNDINNLHNLTRLSLCRSGLTDLSNLVFHTVSNVQELDLSGNPGIGQVLRIELLNHLKSLKKLHLARSGIVNLIFNVNDTNGFQTLEYIDLSENYIKSIEPDILQISPKLKILILSRNSLSQWPNELFNSDSTLKSVLLDGNMMENLNSLVNSKIYRLDEIHIGHNPFVCDCYVTEINERLLELESKFYLCPERNLRNITQNRNKLSKALDSWENRSFAALTMNIPDYNRRCVVIKDWSNSSYQCYMESEGTNMPFSDVEDHSVDCRLELESQYTYWICLLILMLSSLSLMFWFIWWKWWDFKLFIRILKNVAVLMYINKKAVIQKRHFQYDAFVSYSDKDRLWVIEKLIPKLEHRKNIRLCLHERDFQVGSSILENIITSIDKSKCIILVLSQSFVKSQWCQYEMHLAYHRLLEAKRDQMILILLEDIPEIIRPRALQFLMMTKTYIQWPKENNNDRLLSIFWNRLLKALLQKNNF